MEKSFWESSTINEKLIHNYYIAFFSIYLLIRILICDVTVNKLDICNFFILILTDYVHKYCSIRLCKLSKMSNFDACFDQFCSNRVPAITTLVLNFGYKAFDDKEISEMGNFNGYLRTFWNEVNLILGSLATKANRSQFLS